MIRFCTSLSVNTRITSTRWPSSGTKSIIRKANCARLRHGHHADELAHRRQHVEALDSSELGAAADRHLPAQVGHLGSSSGCTCSSESTNTR
jgi:hypothetical protein